MMYQIKYIKDCFADIGVAFRPKKNARIEWQCRNVREMPWSTTVEAPATGAGRFRECVNTEFVYELDIKRGLVNAAVSRAVRLRVSDQTASTVFISNPPLSPLPFSSLPF